MVLEWAGGELANGPLLAGLADVRVRCCHHLLSSCCFADVAAGSHTCLGGSCMGLPQGLLRWLPLDGNARLWARVLGRMRA